MCEQCGRPQEFCKCRQSGPCDQRITLLEAQNKRLREALQELVDIDDGDDPGLWKHEALFENARQALLSEPRPAATQQPKGDVPRD